MASNESQKVRVFVVPTDVHTLHMYKICIIYLHQSTVCITSMHICVSQCVVVMVHRESRKTGRDTDIIPCDVV